MAWNDLGLIARVGVVALGVAFAALIAVFVLHWAPEWLATDNLSGNDKATELGRTRTAVLATVAGMIALVGAIYTGRTFALNRRGQITERFTRAIEQLGSQKLEVRLGGIYALERIAQESSDEHGPILEVLTAYVRENSPWPPRLRSNRGDAATSSQADGDNAAVQEHQEQDDDGMPPEAAVDTKAIVSVLARRELRHEHGQPIHLDLSNTNLRGANARAVNLQFADLSGAQLQGANLREAQLRGANLREAQLQKADLSHAQLQAAKLDEAQLQAAKLEEVQLQGADLSYAQLQGAYLYKAELQGANLNHAQLRRANLYKAQLQRADLGEAQLQGARLFRAQLKGAKLGEAQLQAAYLSEAQLQGAYLGHAQLQGADLSHAQLQDARLYHAQLDDARLDHAELEGAHLRGASSSDATRWPTGFKW